MNFYIFCPLLVTGGPEALHQLCDGLNNLGINAYMYYYESEFICRKLEIPILSAYAHYNIKKCPDNIKSISDLNSKNNTIVIPEIIKRNLFPGNFKAKLIYWFLSCTSDNEKNQYRDAQLKKYYIACQSQEVYDRIIKSEYLDNKKVFKLSDYTKESFLYSEEQLKIYSKKDIILYCLKKKNSENGLKHYQEIFKLLPNYDIKLIQNLFILDVKNLGLKSKVYIDFGSHPGKDRPPREMASTGCIVITGTQNVGGNDIDVPLGNRKFEYNLETDSYDYEKIAEQIKYDLENYQTSFEEQFGYREIIRNEKSVFQEEIKKMIGVLK